MKAKRHLEPHIKRQLAARRLSTETGRAVTIRIGVPVRVRAKEWMCPYSITGLGPPIRTQSRGLDAIQAIITTLASIRRALIDSHVEATWDGGERGDTGFPMYVLNVYGLKFTRKLEDLVDASLDAEATRLQRKSSKEGEDRKRAS